MVIAAVSGWLVIWSTFVVATRISPRRPERTGADGVEVTIEDVQLVVDKHTEPF